MSESVHDFNCTTIKGEDKSLSEFKGKVILIVNTASKCGLTPQYQGLEQLHKKYAAQGLAVLGFPCNQFGNQEPGSGADISEFCEMNYGVSFPIFAKIDVNGADTSPLFAHLKTAAPGLLGSQAIKWNFTKFLVDPSGRVLKRFAPTTKPEAIDAEIAKLLG